MPDEVSLVDAQGSARLAALSVIASVQRAVGDLDRVDAWLTISGFVNATPGYPQTTAVLNTFSEVVLEVFGPAIGEHSRTAIAGGGSAPQPARGGGCGTADHHPIKLTVGDDHSTKCEHGHVLRA